MEITAGNYNQQEGIKKSMAGPEEEGKYYRID